MNNLSIPEAVSSATVSSQRLNAGCFCISLNDGLLREALSTELGSPDIVRLIDERCPFLFSARPVFLSESQQARMAAVIAAVQSVVALPAYRQRIFADAPEISRHDPAGVAGVFFGYDFHVSDEHIGLIEINTNAGGAMLNAVVARAHHACCLSDAQLAHATAAGTIFETNIVTMFQNEWRLSQRKGTLRTIAIVDTSPMQQFLYPEFLLFQRLFERAGLRAVIVDPAALDFKDGVLWHQGIAIDMVYNRLTDFMLEDQAVADLRAAYLAGAVVLTPNPQAHALYADKKNLALLSNAAVLKDLGVSSDIQAILVANIPQTEVVETANAERLWKQRRQLFFKPTAGYGGRAAYRGDKLTKRVWQEILAADYVAQSLVVPGLRANGNRASPDVLKFDIRCYTYQGNVQWTAARLYQGQTTNFRTAGGGFAPVYTLSNEAMQCCVQACDQGITKAG